AKRYRDAGADGFFVPGLADADEIRSVVAEAGLPVNIMSRPDLPSAQELEALGVRRLSAGAAISISAMDYVAGLAGSFLQGTDATGKTLDYGSINALFDR